MLVPPMTMMDFFKKSEGVWFIHRTVHHFDSVADESGESKIHVKMVAKDDDRVQKICASQDIDFTIASCGASFIWQAHEVDGAEPNPDHAAILVDVPHETSGRSGKLLRNQGYVERIPVVSRYWFGDDGILTIDTEYDNNQGQERCWFITDDFRVRVGTVRMNNGVYQMTYCSERRYVGETDLEAMLQRNLARQN